MSSMHQSSKGSKVRNIQIKENAMIYLQNRFYFDVKPTFRHIFPSSNLQCLPRGDPRNLCANTRIPSLATHSSCVQLNLLYTYLLRQNVMNCALLNSSGKEDEKTQELPLLISMKIKCLYLNQLSITLPSLISYASQVWVPFFAVFTNYFAVIVRVLSEKSTSLLVRI